MRAVVTISARSPTRSAVGSLVEFTMALWTENHSNSSNARSVPINKLPAVSTHQPGTSTAIRAPGTPDFAAPAASPTKRRLSPGLQPGVPPATTNLDPCRIRHHQASPPWASARGCSHHHQSHPLQHSPPPGISVLGFSPGLLASPPISAPAASPAKKRPSPGLQPGATL